MKTINKILGLLLFFTLAATGCSRDYDTPPLNKPEYTGPEENITIAELKEQYKDVTQGSPKLIEFEYILKANITSSDASGNIFKQIYIQDKTGGINFGADQNNTSTEYALGQTVYINLHGLYVVEYGGQLQIGYDKTQANRIPWEIFKAHVVKDGWPNLKAIEPTVITDFSKLDDKVVNTLVRLDGVNFPDGGKLPYAEDQKTVNRDLKDAQGNKIILRTSGYSNFYKELLPVGTGSIIGIMGKHNSDWQLTIRSIDDVLDFDGVTPGEPEVPVDPEDPNAKPNTSMIEFASKYAGATSDAPIKIEDDIKIGGVIVSDDTDSNVFKKVYIQDETGGITVGVNDNFVAKKYPVGTKIVFDAKGLDAVVFGGLLQIGSATAGANRIEMAEFEKRAVIVSTGNAVTPKVTTIAALGNVDLNTIIQLDGVHFVEAGQPYADPKVNTNRTIKDATGKTIIMRNSGYSKFAAEILPQGTGTVVGVVETFNGSWQFTVRSTKDVKNFDGQEPEEPTDPEVPSGDVILKETFGANFPKPENAPWPKVADYTGYDNKTVKYADSTTNADIRNIKGSPNHVWLKANNDCEFEISNLPNVNGKTLVLAYDAAANVYNPTDETNLNTIEVWYNGKQLPTESKDVKGKDDLNKFYTLKISDIKGVDGATLKFVVKGAANKYGLRLGNINLSVK